jgi:hypothetical protein
LFKQYDMLRGKRDSSLPQGGSYSGRLPARQRGPTGRCAARGEAERVLRAQGGSSGPGRRSLRSPERLRIGDPAYEREGRPSGRPFRLLVSSLLLSWQLTARTCGVTVPQPARYMVPSAPCRPACSAPDRIRVRGLFLIRGSGPPFLLRGL